MRMQHVSPFVFTLVAAPLLFGLAVGCGKSDVKGNANDSNSSSNNGNDSGGTVKRCTLAGGADYSDPNAAHAYVAPACQATMFNTYKADGFTAVNSNIVTLATDGNKNSHLAELGTSFQTAIISQGSTRINQFVGNLANFLIVAYGGPDNYTGSNSNARSMLDAHKGLNITTAQYTSFITNVVVPSLQNAGVSAADIGNCFAPQVSDPNFKAQIISCQ